MMMHARMMMRDSLIQFCDWKSLSSVLTVNLLHPHQYVLEYSTLSSMMKVLILVALWFGGTFYFKFCFVLVRGQKLGFGIE